MKSEQSWTGEGGAGASAPVGRRELEHSRENARRGSRPDPAPGSFHESLRCTQPCVRQPRVLMAVTLLRGKGTVPFAEEDKGNTPRAGSVPCPLCTSDAYRASGSPKA